MRVGDVTVTQEVRVRKERSREFEFGTREALAESEPQNLTMAVSSKEELLRESSPADEVAKSLVMLIESSFELYAALFMLDIGSPRIS